jgi:glycosyltransferase involved in cell wall biosynthesis/SAM-dependent methyltransferase
MSQTVADALVVAFSEGVSLRLWADTGLIDREWEIYRRIATKVGRIVLVTHGKADDPELLPRLSPGVGLVCNREGLAPDRYLATVGPRLLEQLGEARTVVVKTNQMSGGELAGAALAALRTAGKQAALIARGGYLWSQFSAWESGAASQAAVLAGEREGRVCRAADLVVGTTRQMVDDLAWRHNIPEQRLCVIPNYILDTDTQCLGDRVPTLILFAGRLVPQKRIDRLVEAIAALRDDLRSRVTLSIVGDGPMESQLREMGTRLGVHIQFEGRLAHEELLNRMRRCAVFAQTSSYEGHPKTVIEAMSVGAPVVVSDTPGLRGLVRHGATGLCVPPEPQAIALALEGLLDDEPWRDAIGAAAAEEARSIYGIGNVARQEAAAYARALANAAAHPHADLDVTRAVKWTPELAATATPRMVDAWERSLRAFSRRLDPEPRARFLAAFDATLYNLQGEAAVEAEGGLHPKHRLMRYHEFFTDRIRPGERVIDLGCGVGALAASIADRSRAHVTGMDWTQANLQKARLAADSRGLTELLCFSLGDITRDRAPGSFDTVVLSNVLEHIADRPERLRLWREWYRPNRFLIRVPAFDREWRVPWKKELGVEWRLDLTHETEYTQTQLDDELRRAGLRPSEWIVRWGEYWVVAEAA